MPRKPGLLDGADPIILLSELLRERIVFIPLPQPVDGLSQVLIMWGKAAKALGCELYWDQVTRHPVDPYGAWMCVMLKR